MSSEQYIFGLHAVRIALKYDPASVREVWLDPERRDRRVQDLRRQLEGRPVKIHAAHRSELDKLSSGQQHQGVVARYEGPRPLDEKDLDGLLDGLSEPPFLLVLDQIQDPQNLGACLRTADAAGVHAVVTPRDNAVGLTPTVHKVASGAARTVPFIQVTNLARCLRGLKDRGVWLVGLAGEAEQTLYQADLEGPLALVMGAEDTGLRRLSREHCDFLVNIPMRGQVESLNVSVATGVALFEAVRQRSP